jgi:choline dehydrogenase-like flavoprotein
VQRIRLAGNRVTGVVATDKNGSPLTVSAPLVALCAGALHSPGLLRRSLGDKAPPATGQSLFLHPGAHLVGLFDDPIEPRRGPIQSVFVNGPEDHYIIFGMGYPIELVGVLTMKPGADLSNFAKFNNSLTLAVMVSDHASRGSVSIDGGQGLVVPRYSFHRNDAQHLLEGIAHGAELLLEMGAREVYVGLRGVPPLTKVADARALAQQRLALHRFILGSVHPMGTLPMGRATNAVVDANLRVHGMDGLYVPDASFFPSSLGVNPQMTIMAFALRAAEKMNQPPA